MTQNELMKRCEYYRNVAQRNYIKYQETGEHRFYNNFTMYDDIADAFSRAGSAADDHEKMISLKTTLCSLAKQAVKALDDWKSGNVEKTEDVLKNLISEASWKADFDNRNWEGTDGSNS